MGDDRYNLSVMNRRVRKSEKGHSIVKIETWTVDRFGFGPRKAISCECGRRMTGNGDRAYYSYTAHLKREGIMAG